VQREQFLTIQRAVEQLAEAGRPYSIDRIRGLIDSGELLCAVYWQTRDCWMYVNPCEAVHHEMNGWPRWAVNQPEELLPQTDNLNHDAVWFTDKEDDPLLYKNLLINRIEQGGGAIGVSFQLAKFRPGLFVPAVSIETLASENEHGDTLPEKARWYLCPEPKKLPGYRQALYDYLANAKKLGRSLPSAAEILRDWRDDPPIGFGVEVEPKLREFTYHTTGVQPIKSVSARSLGRAITRLTKAPDKAHQDTQ